MASKPQAVVTGGAHGIGSAVVARLAGDGYAVLSLDLDGAGNQAPAHGTAVVAATADVCDRGSVVEALAPLATIDVLVNCAGVFWPKPFPELTEDDFRAMIEVHVIGAFTVSQEALKRMPRGGRIVNITSRTYIGAANFAHYVTAKSALVGLTRAMAMDLAERGISVNAVAPGLVDTSMPRSLPRELLDRLIAVEPAGKLTDPDVIAEAVAFLATPGRYINGQTLVVDGGKSLGGSGF